MTALLAALMATSCYLIGVRGLLLARDPGSVAREDGPLIERSAKRENSQTRRLEPIARAVSPFLMARLTSKQIRAIDARLDNAGRPGGLTVELFLALMTVSTVGAFLVAFLRYTTSGGLLFPVVGGLVAAMLPVIGIIRAGRQRQGRIQRELPEFMDVLAVVMRAGMSYRSALWRVTDELRGPVAQELRRALREMELGARRRDAFARVGQRNTSPGLRRFIVAQLQAEELGVPLAEAINTLAAELRRDYGRELRKRAMRTSHVVDVINVTFILIGCVLILIVTLFYASGVLGEGGLAEKGIEGLINGRR